MTVRANPALLMALVVCAAVFFVHEAAALDDQVFSVLQFNVWNFDSSVENGGLSWKPDRVCHVPLLLVPVAIVLTLSRACF